MTGTGANYDPATRSGVILPTPIVKIVANNLQPGSNAFPTPPNDGGTKFVNADLQVLDWSNSIVVTAQVDDTLLAPELDLEIQLHKFTGRVNSRNKSGWTTPADWDPFFGTSNAGSHMLGGSASGISSVRRTRAKVATQSQRIGFNVGGFFRRGSVGYIDAATSTPGAPLISQLSEVLLALPVDKSINPSTITIRSAQPWSRRRLTGLFAFSYSIADSSGRTDGRIFGPLSPVVAAGSATHPFTPNQAATATVGFPVCDPNPNYNPKVGKHWFFERQSERS